MVQAFTGFRSTTGKSFDTEFEAWSEELRDFLVKHGADNDAIARKIVQAVVDGQPETLATLADIVENMDRCAPEVVRDAAALDEWDKDAAVWNVPPSAPAPVIQCLDCGRLHPADTDCYECNPR